MLRLPVFWPVLGLWLVSVPEVQAGEALLSFTGNSWERGLYAVRQAVPYPGTDRSGGVPPEVAIGEREMTAVGEIHAVGRPIVWSPQAFSISWHLHGLRLESLSQNGDSRTGVYSGGRITFYTDAPDEMPQYGAHPPNATAPADFADGFSVLLDGVLTGFRVTFDESSGLGTMVGTVDLTGGTAYALLPNPEAWDLVANIRRGGPSGYAFQILGTLSREGHTTAVDARSWGAVKELYR